MRVTQPPSKEISIILSKAKGVKGSVMNWATIFLKCLQKNSRFLGSAHTVRTRIERGRFIAFFTFLLVGKIFLSLYKLELT